MNGQPGPKILLLPHDVIEKIAAGEVVERPASVVKELLENAIDAGATEITVDVRNGGRTLIQVTDNGCGMSKEDAKLAFSRHATSKIRNFEDLERLSTLGFRGEALFSIGAVSKVQLVTCTAGSEEGTRIVIEGSTFRNVETSASPPGTRVTVRSLFFQTPARLKFLRSEFTELARISEEVARLALSFPEMRIKLTHNEKVRFLWTGSESPPERTAKVLALKNADGLLPVEHTSGSITVSGFTGKLNLTKPNRTGQFFFVNQRPVRDPVVSRAVQDAYQSLIPKDSFPVCILFLKVNPANVDVNIHPQKKEVRFQNIQAVRNAIVQAVTSVLREEKHIPSVYAGTDSRAFQSMEKQASYVSEEHGEANAGNFSELPGTGSSAVFAQQKLFHLKAHPVGQVFNTYMLFENQDEVLIVDQHALHERILLEELKQSPSPFAAQQLLFPETLEFTHAEASSLEASLSRFESCGFDLSSLGDGAFLLRCIPQVLTGKDIGSILKTLVSQFTQSPDEKSAVAPGLLQEKILKTIACRSAVKAGDKLSPENMAYLASRIESWETLSPHIFACAHGRPTMTKIRKQDLERLFHRT